MIETNSCLAIYASLSPLEMGTFLQLYKTPCGLFQNKKSPVQLLKHGRRKQNAQIVFCILHQTIMIFLFSSDFKRLKAFAQTHIKSFQILWQNTRLLLISIKFKVFEGGTTQRLKMIIFAHVQNTSKPFSGILVVYQQYCNQCNLGG